MNRDSELESLDTLLLGVLKTQGTVTVHRLFRTMKLSPGSTVRAFAGLAEAGWVRQEEKKKTAFTITDAGAAKLEAIWPEYVRRPGPEVDDILRAVTLAELLDDQAGLEACIPRLQDTAAERRVKADRKVTTAERQTSSLPARHGLRQAIYDAGRLRGEAQALDEIADRLRVSLSLAEPKENNHENPQTP